MVRTDIVDAPPGTVSPKGLATSVHLETIDLPMATSVKDYVRNLSEVWTTVSKTIFICGEKRSTSFNFLICEFRC